MKLLVLDSSGLVASVALIEDDQLIAEYTTGNKLTHSQTLLPMLDEVIKRTSFEIEDIDAVAVAKGPGSFTASVHWDKEKQMIHLQYNPSKTSVDAISKAIAKAGHDTDTYKADQAVYDQLPGCCKYRQ